MQKKIHDKINALDPKKRKTLFATGGIVGIIVVVLILILFIIMITTPQRSVANYCKVQKEEKTRLFKFPGSTYPSGVFDDSLSDVSQLVTSFDRLEKVAPPEIQPDIAILKSIYKKVQDDPSQLMAAALSGASADMNAKAWTKNNCKE